MTDFRALCAELLADYEQHLYRSVLADKARAALSHPEPEGPTENPLPHGYIDPEHLGLDREMLETFYAACRSEGGTADEIHLRGIRAVLARWGTPNPAEVRRSLGDGPAVSDDSEPASVDDSLALRVQRLEAMRETEKAALLDAFRQVDDLKHRIDFHYWKIHQLEEATNTNAAETDD